MKNSESFHEENAEPFYEDRIAMSTRQKTPGHYIIEVSPSYEVRKLEVNTLSK